MLAYSWQVVGEQCDAEAAVFGDTEYDSYTDGLPFRVGFEASGENHS